MNQSFDNESPRKCEKCGSRNVVKGVIGTGTTGFIPEGKTAFSAIRINAIVCRDCGHLFDFELSEINRHKL